MIKPNILNLFNGVEGHFKNTRICIYCKEEKAFSEFPKHKRDPVHGIDTRCFVCLKARHKLVRGLKRTAPPPTESCECCGSKGKLVLDHDPNTLSFRGWLCNECNLMIGRLGDTKESIETYYNNIVAYLDSKRNTGD